MVAGPHYRLCRGRPSARGETGESRGAQRVGCASGQTCKSETVVAAVARVGPAVVEQHGPLRDPQRHQFALEGAVKMVCLAFFPALGDGVVDTVGVAKIMRCAHLQKIVPNTQGSLSVYSGQEANESRVPQ